MLSSLGVDQYIGPNGAKYVDSVIKTSDYDPATAVTKINEAVSKMIEAHDGFSSYISSINMLGIRDGDPDDSGEYITIRVGFQNEASIDNVSDWKDSAKDWYDIIRGLSMAANEAPEDTKIVGASTGSIILILAGTLKVTTLLATISKTVSVFAKQIIGVGIEIENLRQKRLLTKTIESELRKKEQELKTEALKEIQDSLKDKIVGKDGEVTTALENSIKKVLAFNEKGGSVDFVAPEDIETEDVGDKAEGADVEAKAALAEARIAIQEFQVEREALKLLVDGTNKDST